MKDNFERVKKGDIVEVTVHGDRKRWRAIGWYDIQGCKSLGLVRDDLQLMLQRKFAGNLKIIQKIV